MTSADLPSFNGVGTLEPEEGQSTGWHGLTSPFADHELYVSEAEPVVDAGSATEVHSPFTDSFLTDDDEALESTLMRYLVAELDDEEFTEALEALETEAAARYLSGTTGWSHEAGVPALDATEVEQWMASIAAQTDRLLAELEERFSDRSVESITERELDEAMSAIVPSVDGFDDPLDARELFWGSLKKKLKKVAGAVKNVAKKGIKLASKVMPLGIIYGRLRPIVKPLLRRVLATALGKLPRRYRTAAKRVARKFGVQLEAEFENPFEMFAAEFDVSVAEAITSDDPYTLEALEQDAFRDETTDGGEPNIATQLDIARERLTQQMLDAEPGHTPIDEMEQFIPLAILPVVKTGISLIGRKKVVNFLAGLLAKLIKPVVGRQIAKPLSVQIADKGLALLKLEAEAGSDRIGAEAVVAAVEDTVAEVFALPDELLENELYVEAATEEAFHRAAARHFPESFLRRDLVDGAAGGERGVWLMMPRATGPLYRYRKYSRVLPATVTPAMAREVIFDDGETLEERLHDAGETAWPVDVEIEAYELLPGSSVGNLVPFETDEGESITDAADEFDTLRDAGRLPLPHDMERTRTARRRGHRRRIVRVRARGRGLQRKSPVAIRLDLAAQQPTVRLHLWIKERRAHAMVGHLDAGRHRAVMAELTTAAGPPLRQAVASRLSRTLSRHQLTRDTSAATALSNQLFDGLLAVVAKQLPTLKATMTTAAKDPARGLTLTATFRFPSRDAIGVQAPETPTVTVRAGRHRD